MAKPQLLKDLELITAKRFKRTRGVSVNPKTAPFVTEQIQLMTKVYGSFEVKADFEKWIEETREENHVYPLSDYLRVVDSRLGEAPDANKEQVIQITKVVYDNVKDVPTQGQIVKLLQDYSVEDIVEGFNNFIGGIDEKLSGAEIIRKFFVDGGAQVSIAELYEHQS